MYRPVTIFNVPMKLLIPTWDSSLGVDKKHYPNAEDVPDELIFFGSFKTFGGTERNVNDVYVLEDTANIETWYRPDITADCRVILLDTNAEYEIMGTPENIEMRNHFLKFKVKRVKGKA